LSKVTSNSIDLIITSPPYADRRKKVYDGVQEDKYVEWFLPIAAEIKRVLKPTGSFFLNIKPHCDKGERSLYVFDLILSLKRETGFLFIDELCWTKNAFPGKLKGRFKNGFEPVYHFTKAPATQITFNPIACVRKLRQKLLPEHTENNVGFRKTEVEWLH
jgi:DNA modification methylase